MEQSKIKITHNILSHRIQDGLNKGKTFQSIMLDFNKL